MKECIELFVRIEPTSAVPIYRQIIDQIRYQIATGVLKEGDQMPSVRELAGELAVNQNTVLKVYNQLCAEKTLKIERGSGTFVGGNNREMSAAERRKTVAKILREAAVQGVQLEVGLEQMKELLEKEYKGIESEEKRNRGAKS
jgi:GntR family transcriptional regulator